MNVEKSVEYNSLKSNDVKLNHNDSVIERIEIDTGDRYNRYISLVFHMSNHRIIK